jgi:predicted nucleotidyltransferase
MNPTLQPVLKSLKQDLTQLYGDRLVQITLFGSQARGDQEPESDIDVLVVLRSQNVRRAESLINPGEEIKRTGKIVADLSLHYDVVISCIFMDENHYKTYNNALLRNIRKEGVLL